MAGIAKNGFWITGHNNPTWKSEERRKKIEERSGWEEESLVRGVSGWLGDMGSTYGVYFAAFYPGKSNTVHFFFLFVPGLFYFILFNNTITFFLCLFSFLTFSQYFVWYLLCGCTWRGNTALFDVEIHYFSSCRTLVP